MSCVILPSAPMGVVSVSPVARHATIASTALISTASAPSQIAMWNA